ncbi:hypothetical protein DB356_18625 [Pseudomonas congelans]|uniref:hypothetical protein n=1 Tax=Pseudomonas congelans TaxID=200452 RepID=UPI001BDD75EE|nr:hypothetical protein [Pseudomonas congelans]QVX16566.1 hypothetical protein DB356_18625 [Pseudomonas congelans]
MSDICEDFQAKAISHDSLENIIFKQFAAEGIKRVESFLFESFLRARLERSNNIEGLTFSFGWMLGFNKNGDFSYWFRFQEHETDWNEADQALVENISSVQAEDNTYPPSIHRIRFLNNRNFYLAQSLTNERWTAPVTLHQLLNSLSLKKRPTAVRNTKEEHFEDERFEKSCTWIKKDFFKKHVRNLSIQRRLINCFLVPQLGSQIVDLDAVILAPDKKISCLEFKRKYPSINAKVFGLDIHPHIKLISYLQEKSINTRHIILVPPDWDKNTSPLDMLKDSTGKNLWHWLAVNLCLQCIGTTKMNTYGVDSGHSGENRIQHNIEWRAIHLINEGIKIHRDSEIKLMRFLAFGETENLPNVDYEYLNNKRRQTPANFKIKN